MLFIRSRRTARFWQRAKTNKQINESIYLLQIRSIRIFHIEENLFFEQFKTQAKEKFVEEEAKLLAPLEQVCKF